MFKKIGIFLLSLLTLTSCSSNNKNTNKIEYLGCFRREGSWNYSHDITSDSADDNSFIFIVFNFDHETNTATRTTRLGVEDVFKFAIEDDLYHLYTSDTRPEMTREADIERKSSYLRINKKQNTIPYFFTIEKETITHNGPWILSEKDTFYGCKEINGLLYSDITTDTQKLVWEEIPIDGEGDFITSLVYDHTSDSIYGPLTLRYTFIKDTSTLIESTITENYYVEDKVFNIERVFKDIYLAVPSEYNPNEKPFIVELENEGMYIIDNTGERPSQKYFAEIVD